jgi:hypothetical protein
MLGIKVNNEFLDLLPGTTLDTEQNNPFLQFNDEIVGEYSLPIEVVANAKNLRLLNYAGLIQSKIDKKGIDAQVYHEGFQHSIGKLKVEKPTIHLNNGKRGRISCYYLMGISSFYQDAKNQRLKEINAGGVRTFTNDNFNRAGSGFWGHIHKVVDAPAGYGTSGYDYAFYPVLNNEYGRNPSVQFEVMNSMEYTGGVLHFATVSSDNIRPNAICPFPYVKYVLQKAVESCGWRIEGDILNDPQFCKATMVNSLSINWAYGLEFGTLHIHIHSPVKFNLADHLPDISIPEFLIALKNRFGWWYDFDKKNKTIKIKPLINVAQSNIKDLSKYANPVVTKKVNTEKKVYSLVAEGGDVLNFTGVDLQGYLTSKTALPAAAEALASQVYLIVDENNYYICEADDTGVWRWNIFVSGAGSYMPDGENESITTVSKLAPMAYFSSYFDFIPQWDETGYFPGQSMDIDYSADFVLCFYYGVRNNRSGQPIPFGSHHIYDANDNQVGTWSMAFKAKKINGDEVGLYDLNFKTFLNTLTADEEFEATLNLPLVEFLKLNFSDIISINNVRMYVKVIKAQIPYKGSVSIEALRV